MTANSPPRVKFPWCLAASTPASAHSAPRQLPGFLGGLHNDLAVDDSYGLNLWKTMALGDEHWTSIKAMKYHGLGEWTSINRSYFADRQCFVMYRNVEHHIDPFTNHSILVMPWNTCKTFLQSWLCKGTGSSRQWDGPCQLQFGYFIHSKNYYLTNGLKQFTVPLATVRKKSCGFRPAYVNDVIVEVLQQFWL